MSAQPQPDVAPSTPAAASATATSTVNDDGELPKKTVIATLAGIIAAMLMGALDQTITGTAMPKVIAELHGFEHYAAVTTIYMLTSTAVVPIAGKLSDLYGRKPFLLVGVALFVIGSALCGFSTDMAQLVAFRGLQGIGAGLCQSMAFTTIADLFPPARRGKVSGIMGAVFGISSVVGPAVGGFLTDGPGWRWCFWANIPVGIAAFLILLIAFPLLRPKRTEKPSIDWAGAIVLVLGSIAILLGLSWAGRDYEWASPQIIGLLGGGVALTLLFLVVELRAKEPIIPPGLFKNRIVATTTVSATLVGVAMFGSMMFVSLFLQGVIGVSASKSGGAVTPMMFAMILSSMTSGQLMSRFERYKVIAIVGVSLTAVGGFLLTLLDVNSSYSAVLVDMIVLGVGLGSTMPVFNLAVQNAVDARQVGVATSSSQFLRSMGGSMGGAVCGALLSNRFAPALHEALPAGVAEHIPPEMMSKLENPQLLMNPQASAQLHAMPGMESVLDAMKVALSSSLHDVFVFGAGVSILAVIAALLIKDIPLRKTNRVTVESA
jgi:EmrB/QacA subfamily drug resistance transporter